MGRSRRGEGQKVDGLEAPRARYRQVADQLRDAIQRGEYKAGELLPSQPALARQYGLNQTSISRAVAVLQHEGLVRVERGRGAYVLVTPTLRRVRRIPQGNDRGSTFASEVRRQGLTPHAELVRVEVARPPDRVAELLGIDPGVQVLIRERHMAADRQPLQIATSYIPMNIAGSSDIALPDTNPADLYTRLAERGYQASRFSEEIEVRRASSSEASLLHLPEGYPILDVVRITFDQHDVVMDVAVNILHGFQWRLVYEWEGK